MLAPTLSRSSTRPLLLALFALNGVTVSTLYWAQALAVLARLETGPSIWASLMPSATLAGYAVGVALLATFARDLTTANGLGLHALLLAVGLGGAAIAPTPPLIALTCLLIGIGCSLTQRALATASTAVTSAERGPVIGGVIASGLAGIVVARALVPVASMALGWRTMFMIDAVVVCAAGLAAAFAAQRAEFTREADTQRVPSAQALWRREPVLRRAALQQGAVFAIYNFGWAVFPRMLAYDGMAGSVAMGIVASLGAVAAGAAGWACKQRRPDVVARCGGFVAITAGVALAANGTGPMAYLSMTLLDIGTQVALVANQARGQELATSAAMRGRLAAIVTTIGFAAGALGAAIGNALL